jgi:N-acetylmuramoyl-L-alanine amidase
LSRSPARSPDVATIKDIRRSVLPDAVRVIIELDREVPYHDERIPIRFASSSICLARGQFPRWRITRFATSSTPTSSGRFDLAGIPTTPLAWVLDATNVSSYSVYPLYDPFRIVIDCVRTTAVHTAAPVPSRPPTPPLLIARSLAPAWNRLLPKRSPGATRLLTTAYATMVRDTNVEPASTTTATTAEIVDAAPVITSTPAPPPSAPPAKNMNGGFSMSRQLGLGVSRIVIDPGHGGHDPGANGKGVEEAELVLDVALRLEKLLQKAPGVEVILTRRTDQFIPLQERTAIANREGADLFLSIHANASSNPQARGIETYFLNFANNLSAAAVAARENAASGQAMGALPDLVKAIALNNKLDESRDFAAHIQRNMFDRLRGTNSAIKDLGVKQAPFVVLIGAAMPSVLAEISFVTNPQEARLLKGTAYRQRIAEALFNAIRKYQTSLKNSTAVASQ